MNFSTSVLFLILLHPAGYISLSFIFSHPEVQFACHITCGNFLGSPLLRSHAFHSYSPRACVSVLVLPFCTVVQVVHCPTPGIPLLSVQVSVFTWLQGSREGLLFPNLQLCVQPHVTEPSCSNIYVVICILSLSLLHWLLPEERTLSSFIA